jgi:threonine dehydrogenase-like Zn-dependent dehydrogenase
MKAVTWQGFRDISVEEVADPVIKEPNDPIIKVTSTNICGSDLHLYETMGAFMSSGDVLGHEEIGIVLEVGRDITQIRPGDRVVVPFQISCGHCWMCERRLYTQCETTQVRGEGSGAALFGYSKLYGQVPGAQAEYLRVPEAQSTHILVPRTSGRPLHLPVRRTFRQRGRGWSTPESPTVVHCSSWASGRSETWPAHRPAEADRQDHRGGPGR